MVGAIARDGLEQVLIRDELGTIHTLRLGSYIGENNGIITKIESDAITITQIIIRDGRREEKIVKFSMSAALR